MTEDSRTYLSPDTSTKAQYINQPSVDLMTDTGMGTQALYGQRFEVIEMTSDLAYGALYSILPSAERIDYIGRIPATALSEGPRQPSHYVRGVSAAVFEAANIKSKLLGSLPRNAAVSGVIEGDFLSLVQGGYIHLRHLSAVGESTSRSFMAIASDMLALPYIWGGTGYVGVDCSGLVQSALAATGVDAPRDADQQEAALGHKVEYVKRQAGDLLFWPGHVGIIVEDDQLLHANAFHMCVALEPLTEAVSRIGDVRTLKRLTLV